MEGKGMVGGRRFCKQKFTTTPLLVASVVLIYQCNHSMSNIGETFCVSGSRHSPSVSDVPLNLKTIISVSRVDES